MKQPGLTHITDKDGLRGTVVTDEPSYENSDTVTVRLEGGESVAVPRRMLEQRPDGSYYVPIALSHLEKVVPIIEETLEVQRRRVETGRYRITKHVERREEVVDEPVYREDVHIARVPINRVVEEPMPVRQEGDTIIVPVLEEVLIVKKQLILKEELHITKRRKEERKQQNVTLRSEDVTVERVDSAGEMDTQTDSPEAR